MMQENYLVRLCLSHFREGGLKRYGRHENAGGPR